MTRLLWLELRGVGWPALAALLLGTLLAASTRGHLPASEAGFSLAVWTAAALGLGLALLPSPGSDPAWEVTATAARPPGERQLRWGVALLLFALALLAVLTPLVAPGREATQLWSWFAPRAAWFAAPTLLALLLSGRPSVAAGAVGLALLGMEAMGALGVPFAYSPGAFFEPRPGLHAAAALLLGGVLLANARWIGAPLASRAAVGATVALLVFAPALPALRPPQVDVPAPPGWTGITVLQAPWAALHGEHLPALLTLAEERGGAPLRVLTAYPEQGEPDGTALAQALGVRRFPVVLDVVDGRIRSVPWRF